MSEKRTERVVLKYRPSEMAELKRCAAMVGLPVSQYLKMAIQLSSVTTIKSTPAGDSFEVGTYEVKEES